jgi:CPA2 family monovalent cation:H+ antiporter-2
MEMADRIRSGSYTALRNIELRKRDLFEKCEWLPEMEIDGYRVAEGSHLAGQSIAGLQIRKKTGATVIAVRRGPEVFTSPEPDFRFIAGDIVLFTGETRSMENALNYFRGGARSSHAVSEREAR